MSKSKSGNVYKWSLSCAGAGAGVGLLKGGSIGVAAFGGAVALPLWLPLAVGGVAVGVAASAAKHFYKKNQKDTPMDDQAVVNKFYKGFKEWVKILSSGLTPRGQGSHPKLKSVRNSRAREKMKQSFDAMIKHFKDLVRQ